MNLLKILKKILIGGTWYVGLRAINEKPKSHYNKVEVPDGQWLADPFLFEDKGRHFLFCEHYFENRNRACISCFEIIKGKAVNGKTIIERPYHMSYPCVFKLKGQYFIIPESSANNTIDIYESTDFPYAWRHKKTLLFGEKYVDSTVYFQGDKCFLLSYKKNQTGWSLVFFLINAETLSLTKLYEKEFDINVGRPAGSLFVNSGKLIRPAQDCVEKYGENIIFYQVDDISKDVYTEHKVGELQVNSLEFAFKINRVHTINMDSMYEVIDVFKEKLDLLHGFKIFKRAYLKK